MDSGRVSAHGLRKAAAGVAASPGGAHGTSLGTEDAVRALVERLERPSDGTAFQFERLGFYAVDPDATTDRLVFNLTVPLKSGAPVKKEAGVSRKAQQEADRLKKLEEENED